MKRSGMRTLRTVLLCVCALLCAPVTAAFAQGGTESGKLLSHNAWSTAPPRLEIVCGSGDALMVGSVHTFTKPGALRSANVYDRLYVRLTDSNRNPLDIAPYFDGTDRRRNQVWVQLPDNAPLVDAYNAGQTDKLYFGSVSPNVAWRGTDSAVAYDCPTKPVGYDPSYPDGPNATQKLNAELVKVRAGQGLPGIQGDVPATRDYYALRVFLRVPRNVVTLGTAGTDRIRLKARLIADSVFPGGGALTLESAYAEIGVIPDAVQHVEVFKSWGKPAGTAVPMEGWSPISAADALAAGYSTGTPKNAAEGAEFYKGYFFRAMGAVPPGTNIAFPTPVEPVNKGIGGFLASDVSLDGDCTAPIPMDTVMVSEHNQQMRIVARLLDQYNNPVGGRLVKFFIESATLPTTAPATLLQDNAQRGGFGEFGNTFLSDDTLKRSSIGDTATAGWVTAFYNSGRVAQQIVRIALTPDTLAFDLSSAGHNLGEGTAVGESRRGFAPRVLLPLYLTSGPTVRVEIYPYTAAATSPIPLPVDLVRMQGMEHVSAYPASRVPGYGPYFHAFSANPYFADYRGTHLGRMANSNIRPYIPDTLNLSDANKRSVNSVTAGRIVTLLAREYDRFGNLVELQLKPPYDQNSVGNTIDTARITFRIWGENFGPLPAPYNAPGGGIAPSRDWTNDEYGPMRKARYRHTQISNLVSGVHINQTSFLTALEYPTPKTADATVYVEATANAWPDVSRPGATEVRRDTCKIVSVTKTPTRFDILRAGQEYVASPVGRFLGKGTPETRTIDLTAPQINLPAGSDRDKEIGRFDAVSVDHILINQAYKRNLSSASVGKYLVVNKDNVPLDRKGNPLYLTPDATQINPAFERHPYSNLPVFPKLDVYNNLDPLSTPADRFNQLNGDMQKKLGYTIPGARLDPRAYFFDITIAGGGSIFSPIPLSTEYGNLPYEGIGWQVVTDNTSKVESAVNQRPVLLRATPVWENTPPTGGNDYGPAMFSGANAQPGQIRVYGKRLYADSVYTYTNAPFGGAKANSVRGELMGTFTDRGRPGSFASQTGGEYDRITRLGASGWRAEDFSIAGFNAMTRSKNAAGVWGGIDNNGGQWTGDFNRRVLVLSSAFGSSSGALPIAPGAFLRLVDSTSEQVLDLRVVDPTLLDMAGRIVDDTASYDQGKWTVVRKAQRVANNIWYLDDTYWRGGEGIEDGIQGPNCSGYQLDEIPCETRGVPWLRTMGPDASIGRYYFGPSAGATYLPHTFVVVPYRIAYLSLFPSSYDPAQSGFDNSRLPMGILPTQADIDTLPRIALGYYGNGVHDLRNFEMYTRLYGQVPHGGTDQIPTTNAPYARPDTVFRDVRYTYNVTPYDRYGNHNTRDTIFVKVGARYTDWQFTNVEPSGTLFIRSGGNWFGAMPVRNPSGPDNTSLREDTLRVFNPIPQSNYRNEYVGIKPDDRRLTMRVGDPGGLNIPHGILPANVISSRPVWVKQPFPPAPFVLSTAALPNRQLFRLDHTGSCNGNEMERDTLRLQWQQMMWSQGSGKNNTNDTLRYEWFGIIDSVGVTSTRRLVVSLRSDDNGLKPALTMSGDKLRAMLIRPGVQPQPSADSIVQRVKWFVKVTNKVGMSAWSDTAGVTMRSAPAPSEALLVSINRPPQFSSGPMFPPHNVTVSGINASSGPIDMLWPAARDANIDKGALIGGFKVFDAGSQAWIDDPAGRRVDTIGYQWVGRVLRTAPAGKGAAVGTVLVKNTGSATACQLSPFDLDALFGGYSKDASSRSADSVILEWMVFAKDAARTDAFPMEDVTFRYNPDGTLRSDTALWSYYGCRPHEDVSLPSLLKLTKLDGVAVEISRADDAPDIDTVAGAEVEFTLTAKRSDGSIVRDWDATGVPTTLTITGSTANTDSSVKAWNSDALGRSWSVITNNGQNITQLAPDEYVISNSTFVNGETKIRLTDTKAERGVQILCSPLLSGLKQRSAKMNFIAGPVKNFLIEITSSTPKPDQVYKMRMYEIVVSPRDRYLNVSSERVEARCTARFPSEYDTSIPGLSNVFGGNVVVNGPSSFLLASRITRVKGQDELAWVQCRGVADTSATGRSNEYEILDHAPNEFTLSSPVDHAYLRLGPSRQTEQFVWNAATPPDPYTRIQVSRFDPRTYSDDVRYTIVFVDSLSLTRVVKFTADSAGAFPSFSTTHGQLIALMETISGQKTMGEYNLIWHVEASDGLYTTLSTPPNRDPARRTGYHVFLRKLSVWGIEELPRSFDLGQNYPNPFNPSTTIPFSLPKAALVTMTVYDALGTPVKTLLRDFMDAGAHSVHWDGRDETGQALPSGSYVLRMAAGEYTLTRVMVLMK